MKVRSMLGAMLGLVLTGLPLTGHAGLIVFGSGEIDTATGPSGAFPSIFLRQLLENPGPDLAADLTGETFDFTFDVDRGSLSVRINPLHSVAEFAFFVPGVARARNGDNLVLSGSTQTNFAMLEFVKLSFGSASPFFDLAVLEPDLLAMLNTLRVDLACPTCTSIEPIFLEGRVLQVGFRQVPEPGAGLFVVIALAFVALELRRRARSA